MDLNKVVFLGGNPTRLASVQIRCIEIARRLGCDYLLKTGRADAIPDRYSVFVCVKPDLGKTELWRLAKRGAIIWDIIDQLPLEDHISVYITSNSFAKNMLASYGRVELIPHHHCNASGEPNLPNLRRPAWIGNPCWRPNITGFKYDKYYVHGMGPKDVAKIHKKIGIGLNLRVSSKLYRLPRDMQALLPPSLKTPRSLMHISRNVFDLHIAVNSGIKLINCLGFGIPSISSDEPAYHEIGEKCTIFTDLKNCSKWVRALQSDDDLYNKLRKECLRRSDLYHIDNIAEKYRALLQSL